MAKTEKEILGMIDCPHCGESGGMGVKHDKNLEPFGHCEECGGQLRVGGKPGRVRKFCRRYPWAVVPGTAPVPVTVTVTEPQPVAVAITKPIPPDMLPKPTPTPAPAAKRKATFADALNILAGVPA